MLNLTHILFRQIKLKLISKLPITNYQLPRNGQSIIEIVVALGIFAIIAGTMASSILGSLTIHERSSQYLKAGALAREGLEAARAIRNRGWNELVYSRSAVTAASGRWEFTGEGTTEDINGFSRTIDFMPVYRDSNGNLVDVSDPDANLDNNSQSVIATITWDTEIGTDGTLSYTTYLTNWQE